MLLEEVGAKMTYWARKYDKKTKKYCRALAYRSGTGNIGTIYTTVPDIDEGRFHYKLKKDCKIPRIARIIRVHMSNTVHEITFGQGGSEWHFVRSGLGLITSSVASTFFKLVMKENLMSSASASAKEIVEELGNDLGFLKRTNSIEIQQYTNLELKNQENILQICLYLNNIDIFESLYIQIRYYCAK